MIFTQIWAFLSNPVNWSGPEGIPVRLLEHLGYTAIVILIALAIALPLGAIIGHTRRGARQIVHHFGMAVEIVTPGFDLWQHFGKTVLYGHGNLLPAKGAPFRGHPQGSRRAGSPLCL